MASRLTLPSGMTNSDIVDVGGGSSGRCISMGGWARGSAAVCLADINGCRSLALFVVPQLHGHRHKSSVQGWPVSMYPSKYWRWGVYPVLTEGSKIKADSG